MKNAWAITLASATLAVCSALPSQATEFCLIAKTQDGFAALRAAPQVDGRRLAQMKTGEEVQLAQGVKGRWRQVIYWRGDDRLTKGYGARTATGWVDGRLLEDCG
jgi:hypothetical protein